MTDPNGDKCFGLAEFDAVLLNMVGGLCVAKNYTYQVPINNDNLGYHTHVLRNEETSNEMMRLSLNKEGRRFLLGLFKYDLNHDWLRFDPSSTCRSTSFQD